MSPRQVKVEWLDHLPASHPQAVKSRRDLRLLNRLMGHSSLLKRALWSNWQYETPHAILDLGAGDGTMMLMLARKLARSWPGVSLTLLDRQQLVSENVRKQIAAAGWNLDLATSDVFEFLEKAKHRRFDLILANLFLHHFNDAHLVSMLERIATMTKIFIALEPSRSWPAIAGSCCVGLLGCNSVTRHDAFVSAQAGFMREELTNLWPSTQDWHLRESRAGLFSHCFIARRHG